MQALLTVIHEDDDLLVVSKPAGLVCHPTKGDVYSSLISRVRLHLGPKAEPHLVNRLDRETSGVIVIAKNGGAALELRRLWEQRRIEKTYLAMVYGCPLQPHGIIDAPLGKDDQSRVAIKDCVRPDGALASTEYWLERGRVGGNSQTFSLLRVMPHSGRKHQIRIHLAHLGHPIVGDKLYGADEDAYLALVEDRLTGELRSRLILPYQALHAQALRFHWRGREVEFRSEPEPWFLTFLEENVRRPTNGQL